MSILMVMFSWSTSNLSSVDYLTVSMLVRRRLYFKGECCDGVVHFLLVTSCSTNPAPSSGGVPLIIVGTNLDAAVSPMLTLTAAGVQLINVVSGVCTILYCTDDPILQCTHIILHKVSVVKTYVHGILYIALSPYRTVQWFHPLSYCV